MNNCTIQLDVASLRAVILFSASKDSRCYLKSVYVEANESETRMTATDGHVLAVMRHGEINGMGGRAFIDLIIPADTIASALKMIPKGITHLTVLHDAGRWILEANSARLPFEPIDAKFPQYRAVIPNGTPGGRAAQFDPDLLVRFKKAAKALGLKQSPVVHHDQPGYAALVTLPACDDFAGVIMPIRVDAADMSRPCWMQGTMQREAAAQAA